MNYLQQLQSIRTATNWSQEQLAGQLSVSFATLNSWLNQRSTPRKKSLLAIERLYLRTVGSVAIEDNQLQLMKAAVTNLQATASTFTGSRKLLDKLTLYFTYHTNTIEGSTMTLADVGEVLFENKVLSNRTAIEQAEARNHQAALAWILETLGHNSNLALDSELVRGIHLRLMNGIVSDAGLYRRHSVRIMGSRTTVANWIKVPDLLEQICNEANKPSDDIVAQLAKIHANFEQIHPFSDGNGRTGRLLLLAMALRANVVPPIVIKERKYAYYKYLELAQTADNYQPLELFVAESMLFASELFAEPLT